MRKKVCEEKISHLREVEICSAGMPRHCSAGGCKSRDNRETRNAGITFHKLPKGSSRRSLWITNSHRADSWVPQTDFVYFCSKHFTPDSFELTGCSGIRRLKEDAFPTVFNSSSRIKCKRAGTPQNQEDISVRKSPCSGDQQHTQKETDQGQNSEEPTVQRSLAVSEEIPEYIPEFSQESSGVEQLFRQEHAPSPSPECRPLSPSHYMKRLPPPPGFYLSKEHSYAQLCPLLWRRRYDQAIACLEKALRQLHAARRRENRLRSTVLRLRDKRLKHTLLVSQDGCNSKGSLSQGGEKKQGKEGSNQEESETHDKTDNTEFFKDRCVDHMELGGHSLPGTNSCSKKEKGYCLYCGREQVQVGGQVAHSLSKSDKDVQPTEDEHSEKIQRSVEISIYGTAENTKDTKLVRPERPFEKKVQTSNSDVAHFQILLQTPRLQHVIPTGVSLPDNDEQSLQFLGSKQKLLLSNMCEGESEAVGQEHQLDLQQQLFWIQDCPEGQVILVPVPAEDGLESFLKMEGVVDEAKTILVSGLDLKRDLEYMTENSGALPRVEKVCEDEHSDQHFVINNTLVERREDVREKLKEHLEGFHLQLSTEFIN